MVSVCIQALGSDTRGFLPHILDALERFKADDILCEVECLGHPLQRPGTLLRAPVPCGAALRLSGEDGDGQVETLEEDSEGDLREHEGDSEHDDDAQDLLR